MLDYKECSLAEFEAAMQQKNADISTISSEHLFILYTKFKADACACGRARTSYAYGVGLDSSRKANAYKEELQRRGFIQGG